MTALGQKKTYEPRAQLVPILGGEAGLPRTALTAALALQAAERGQSVLIVDCDQGRSFAHFGVKSKASLDDVLKGRAAMRDAKCLAADGHLTLTHGGDAALDDLLGALAAMSLSHDWVFVLPKSGCTPAHVRLAAAADHNIMVFDSAGDRFMRAYWMLDAIRARASGCDPIMACAGPKHEARDAYGLFAGTVREFLGAPPALGAIIDRKSVSIESARTVFAALSPDAQSAQVA